MRNFRLNAILLGLLLTGPVMAQKAPTPAAAASAPEAPSVRPEVGKPLLEAQTLLGEKKYAQVKEKIVAANAIADRTPYENYIIGRVTLSTAILEDDAPTMARAMEQVLKLNETGKWLKPQEVLAYVQNSGIVYYRTKDYVRAAAQMEEYVKLGGTDAQVKTIRLQAYLLGKNYQRASELSQEEISDAEKNGRVPQQAHLEYLAQARDRLDDKAGYLKALEALVQHYPKKDYWQSLVNRLWSRPDLATRLQLDVYRLAAQTGTLQEVNDYNEYMDLAQKAGYSAEALKVWDAGAQAGLVGTGANAEAHKKLRVKLASEVEQDRKTMAADTASAMKKPDGSSMVKVGLGLVALQQADKGLDLMEKGIAKGVPSNRADDARLHLAYGQLMAGQTEKAAKTFASVSGKEGLDELGRYWVWALKKP